MLPGRSIVTTSSVHRAGRSTTSTITTSVGPGARTRPAHHRNHRNEQDLTDDLDPRNPGDRGACRPTIRTGDHTRRHEWRVI